MHAWQEVLGTADNRREIYIAQYEYVVDGQQYLAKHGTSTQWAEGPVWVVYDPKNPKDSMPVLGS